MRPLPVSSPHAASDAPLPPVHIMPQVMRPLPYAHEAAGYAPLPPVQIMPQVMRPLPLCT